jgi:hypothetical protein
MLKNRHTKALSISMRCGHGLCFPLNGTPYFAVAGEEAIRAWLLDRFRDTARGLKKYGKDQMTVFGGTWSQRVKLPLF